MPLDKLNAALIAAIQNGTPEYTNPAAILTDKLNIGREAAYRRLRGEVPFTFGEAAVLSAQMNFRSTALSVPSISETCFPS